MALPAHMVRTFVGAALALTLMTPSWAFFGDDEARKAIVELRQALEEQRRVNGEGAAVMRRSILDISTQAEQWRLELGVLRGEQEQLVEENKRLTQALADLESRIKIFEPVSIQQDGTTLLVSPPEKLAFDQGMALLLASDFARAAAAYVQILNQYPNSAYTASVLYWLGNAQYASQDLKGAINTHKRMAVQFPMHTRVPEAMLSMGNAHQELGDVKSARSEWDNLIATHPTSEAAGTARERLKTLPRQ